jgi:hypothetical protein
MQWMCGRVSTVLFEQLQKLISILSKWVNTYKKVNQKEKLLSRYQVNKVIKNYVIQKVKKVRGK